MIKVLFCVVLMLGSALGAGVIQTFGSGRSQITILAESEYELLNYNISASASSAAITFFWITGDPLSESNSASGVDIALWRFYLDGETQASIGPLQTAQAALVGDADPSAPWNNDFFGKNSLFGGWHFNLLIPFARSVRVTIQMPASVPHQRAFAMVRGVEDMPLTLGSFNLPPTARLHAVTKTSLSLPILDFHELVALPGQGIVLASMLDLSSADSGSLNSLEGCWHAFNYPATQSGPGFPSAYPGLVIGTGAEDYPESAYYFNAGPYRGPTSGLTVMRPGSKTVPSRVSFYKLHHRDPLVFSLGLSIRWRNGDVSDPQGEKCRAIAGAIIGSPGVSNVSSLVYAYTW